jgi:hypothetical protein
MRVLALLALAAAAASGQNWTSLFDGRSLAGWHVAVKPADRDQGYWSVHDGAITCDSLGRAKHDYVWLMSDKEYGDFELRLEVRSFSRSPGNSGVQVRSRFDVDAQWLDGPQIDIHPPGPWRTGLIYDETRETRRWIYPSLPDYRIEPSQGPRVWKWEPEGWNRIRIECFGARIRTWANEIPIADFDGTGLLNDPAHVKHGVGLKGYLALQLHTGDELLIQYRNIEIRPIE